MKHRSGKRHIHGIPYNTLEKSSVGSILKSSSFTTVLSRPTIWNLCIEVSFPLTNAWKVFTCQQMYRILHKRATIHDVSRNWQSLSPGLFETFVLITEHHHMVNASVEARLLRKCLEVLLCKHTVDLHKCCSCVYGDLCNFILPRFVTRRQY